MENGSIPLRHSSLPGVIKLPKRFEPKDTEPAVNGRRRKFSVAQPRGNTIDDRIDDVIQAIIWLKQELIEMRQHDVLLKRQFMDIHDTIRGLHRSERKPADQCFEEEIDKVDNSISEADDDSTVIQPTFVVRSSSITNLASTDGTETRGGDGFDDDREFRPRTCSLTTTRDLAALARRRGSKEASIIL